MSVGADQVAFDVDDTLLVSKLIEGNYPNYRQVIPGEAKERVTLERETLPQCRASRFAARQREVELGEAGLSARTTSRSPPTRRMSVKRRNRSP